MRQRQQGSRAGPSTGALLFLLVALFVLPGFRPQESASPGPTDLTFAGSAASPDFLSPGDTTRARVERRRHGRQIIGQPEVPVSESFKSAATSSSDTSKAGQLSALDSLRLNPPDSTARIKQFQYVRHDEPEASPFSSFTYPLFLRKPLLYQRVVTLDSTGKYVTVRETVDGKDVKVPITMTLDEYIKLRFKRGLDDNWAVLARRYESKQKGDELGSLLRSITKIEIPIPSNPLINIFGGGGIRLNISGQLDITAALRNQQMQQVTTSRLGNVRNEPDFNQQMQINVNGQVGDKLNILADWNTQRTFDYENQLKIKYTGYPDEIIQSIEAGNVSLATSSGLTGGGQALFGVKAAAQLGPLRLTAIASQKKGQTKEMTASGGSQQTTFEKHAYDYTQNHFFLDTLYRSHFEEYYGNAVPVVYQDLRVNDIEVWVTRPGFMVDPTERSAVAYLNLPPMPPGGYPESLREVTAGVAGQIENGQFIRLKPDEQYIVQRETGYITLLTNVQPEQAIAVSYRTDGGMVYGTFVTPTDTLRLILKLVKPKNLIPDYSQAWSLMLKNIYPLGGRNLRKEGFELAIYYQTPGNEALDNVGGKNLLYLFGFDKIDQAGNPVPDGKFDFISGITVDPSRGEIIFPSLEPFRGGLIKAFQKEHIANADSFVYSQVYDTTVNGARTNNQRDRFIIRGKYTSEVTSTYNLGFNLAEGSVQVLLNNQPLTPNVDYTVDYILGQVTIRNQAALVPGANLQIKYEANDVFQMASKTLLGTRGDLRLSDNIGLGFTLMNYNQQTLSDKVRLKEEPISNTIFGIDGSAAFDMPFLTNALNFLPGIQTRAPSSLMLKGEAAYMMPNPNTKTSPFPVDNGKGVAFIDDFEGSKKTIPIGVGYTQWRYGSVPVYVPALDPDSIFTLPDTAKMFHKAKTVWYNIIPSDVDARTIWPKKEVAFDQSQVTVLNVEYHPERRGEYNYSTDLEHGPLSPRSADRAKGWGGIMKLLQTNATNLLDENMSFIEIWMKVIGNPGNGKMYIDLGQVSEDVIPNHRLDTEDGADGQLPSGILRDGEDRGIDGVFDDKERQTYAAFIQKYPQYADDPSGDDWSYIQGSLDFAKVNGTEGNAQSEIGRFPDTEDLNLNGVVDLANNYFEYDVNLDTSFADPLRTVRKNPQVVGGGNNGWFQFRIPLKDFNRKIGNPSLSVVEYVRVWFSGESDPIMLRIADFNLVGNQWQQMYQGDSTLAVTVVNIEDNPDYSASDPPGYRQVDRTRPDQKILSNEQSLALVLHHLTSGDSRYAVKYFPPDRPLDMFSYGSMKMFVHGDTTWSYLDTTRYSAELVMRFGSDTLNYYEYREPIHPGWNAPTTPDSRNNVTVVFSELTALKLLRDSLNVPVPRVPTRHGPPGSSYSLLGNPSLTTIRFFAIGVQNPAGKGPTDLNGSVWLNELRVTDVEDTPGWAYRVGASVKLADFASISAQMSTTDPFFHGLDDRFGSRILQRSWGINSQFNLEKLLPAGWTGTTAVVSVSHNESIAKPRFMPNTDVIVTEAAARQEEKVLKSGGSADSAKLAAQRVEFEAQTIRVTDSYALPTLRIVIPSDHWWIKSTINEVSLGFNYTSSIERGPAVEIARNWAWNGKLVYSHQFAQDAFVSPFASLFDKVFFFDAFKGYKIYYSPQSLTFSAGMNRSRSTEVPRPLPGQFASTRPVMRAFNTTRGFAFTWKFAEGGLLNPSLDYSMDATGNLAHLEMAQVDSLHQEQRPFSAILKDIFFHDRIIDFGVDNQYQQRVNVTLRPKVPPVLSLDRYVDLTGSYSSTYGWQYNFQQYELGKSARVNTSLAYSMNVKLKQMTDPWFELSAPAPTGRGREEGEPADTSKGASSSTPGVSPSDVLKRLLKLLIKTPLLDYETINITFTQSNNAQNTGVTGRTGFKNFWGRVPFFEDSKPDDGPSFLYQLGLVYDPMSPTSKLEFGSRFPFVSVRGDQGRRAPKGNLIDNFTQSNKLNLKTSRPLWEGASLDLSWNVGWNFSRNQNLTTDSLGQVFLSTATTTGDVERSFLSFPSFLFFKFFKTNLAEVGKKFDASAADTSVAPEDRLTMAFEDGMEAFPLLRKLFGKYAPRINWALRWDGLEKMSVFQSFASRVSIDHAYQSTYTERWRSSSLGGTVTDAQRVAYNFNPLVGVNVTFKELLKGNATANFRYSTGSGYELNTSSRSIVESTTGEFSLTTSYGRRGFSIPFFGINLQNDIDVAISVTYSKNSRRTYDVTTLVTNPEGTPLEGSTRMVIEPRIKYVLSSTVTASLFYRRTSIKPEAGASRVIGQTTNEGGLEVHIAIQPR